jgi:hypothetical protein
MRFMVVLRFGFVFMDAGLLSGTGGRLRGDLVLAGSAAGTLAGDHHSLEEELTAPDAPGLPALECSVEAQCLDRAALAEELGVLHVGG